jgi:hypothetical protein
LVPKQAAVPWQVMVAASTSPHASSTIKTIDANSKTLFLNSSTFLQRDGEKAKPRSLFTLQEQHTGRGS